MFSNFDQSLVFENKKYCHYLFVLFFVLLIVHEYTSHLPWEGANAVGMCSEESAQKG